MVVVAALQLRPAAPILATALRGRRVELENCWKSLQTDQGRAAGHWLAHLLATLGRARPCASLPSPPAVTQRPAAGRQPVEHISSVVGPQAGPAPLPVDCGRWLQQAASVHRRRQAPLWGEPAIGLYELARSSRDPFSALCLRAHTRRFIEVRDLGRLGGMIASYG